MMGYIYIYIYGYSLYYMIYMIYILYIYDIYDNLLLQFELRKTNNRIQINSLIKNIDVFDLNKLDVCIF